MTDKKTKTKKNRDQYPIPQRKLYSVQQEHFHLEVHYTYSPKGTPTDSVVQHLEHGAISGL